MKAQGFLTTVLVLALWVSPAGAVKIKDLADLKGARENQLMGYGLVVGLAGTGDSESQLTNGSLSKVLGVLGADRKAKLTAAKSAASVLVTATIPPFAQAGKPLDIFISAVGDAKNLEGGTLIATSLKGADGQVYALASGRLLIEKKPAPAEGGANDSSSKESPSVTAWIPGGALLEQTVAMDFANQKELEYELREASPTTAARIAYAINERLGGRFASAVDPGSVNVIVPFGFGGSPVDLIARIEGLDVEMDHQAKIVVSPRTGTLVLGEGVRVFPVAITHGNLRIEVEGPQKPAVKKPEAGDTAQQAPQAAPVPPKEGQKDNRNRFLTLEKGASLAEVAAGLNAMGAGPEDLIAIINALKRSGALVAQVEVQ